MPPYTIHAVLTTDTSISVGGHFFSNFHFDLTFKGFLAEYFEGNFLTNAAHAQAAVILFRAVIYVHKHIFSNEALHGALHDDANWFKIDDGRHFLSLYIVHFNLILRYRWAT